MSETKLSLEGHT